MGEARSGRKFRALALERGRSYHGLTEQERGEALVRVNIGSVADIEKAGRKVVAVGEAEVGVFSVKGKLVAWRNECPHMGGPVCQGGLFKRVIELLDAEMRETRQDQHPEDVNIVCPWHGVEFDLVTGQAPPDPRLRLTAARLDIVDGNVWLDV